MKVLKIRLDRSKCTALGICESIAPEFFEVDEDGLLALLRDDVAEDQRALAEQAVAGCPTCALSLETE